MFYRFVCIVPVICSFPLHDDALIANRIVIYCQHNLSILANVSTDTLQCHKEANREGKYKPVHLYFKECYLNSLRLK